VLQPRENARIYGILYTIFTFFLLKHSGGVFI
jgi:hypothetical protein